MKGKAVVFTDRLQVKYQDVDIPDPGEHDVVVEVEYSWISIGTESSYLRGERISGETAYQTGDPWPFPIAAGYQKVGVITAAGRNVRDLQAGDQVFAATSRISGMFNLTGGHINPAVTHESQVWKLPAGSGGAGLAQGAPYSARVPAAVGGGRSAAAFAGMVLTQVGYNCGSRAPVKHGDRAVVIGDGLVGHWSAQTLTHRGAQVIMLGRHASRLAYADPRVQCVDLSNADVGNILSASGPVSAVIDTVGSMQAVEQIMPFMERDSHIVSAGFLGTAGIVDIQKLRLKEMTLHTPSGWTKARMDETLKGIDEGWLKTEPLITHRFPAERAGEAWETILHEKQACLGVILDWRN
ncbi:hypothetical protein [Paenibacillus piri]|uniref:Alcohol dehydrogenase-like C-terminal domain-containing protein n=1 Tax=Paenibacillus piri TaxID=2547395 RepID=A0A4R5KSD9_9BACL|nr:hypothetical protein [Paenibacillus piri]TDF98773.1 hypothetical protein E1757_09635 [Paenibacillus piri]